MDIFKKITISHFIWYLVPGLGLIFFILLPVLVFNPSVANLFFQTVGSFGIIVLGIILGFFLDGLRLYRFRPRYKSIRNDFFQELKNTIARNLDPYFIQSQINDVAIKNEITGLSLHHAIWIMLGHFRILALFEAILWIFACLYILLFAPSTYSLFDTEMSKYAAVSLCNLFSFIFLMISMRFRYISEEDQRNTNKMYISYAKQHRDEIRKLLNVNFPDGKSL